MKLFGKLFVLLALMSLLAACGGGSEPTPLPDGTLPTEAPVEETATEEPAPTGFCSLQYHPVAEGATWNYQGTGDSGPFSWTATTSSVTETSFVLTQNHTAEGEPLVVTQHWNCSPEGVTAMEFGGGADATLTYSGLNATMETLETTGITLPREVNPGDTWQQTFVIQGVITMEDIVSNTSGNITQSYEALAIEPVSTPAGAFDALKVNVTTSFDLQVSVMGITVPFSLTSTNTTWMVPNIGWVRTEGSATVDGTSGFSTSVDLVSYSIP